ncbi:hypothetical protein J5N97_019330 [Dioscorea zingiberensis]|uniref:Uncharacterized protein n=1 Tax=Dioscorea zingiberensis TaxID=325984 RepID=A0A9D5HC73_9LILI|nr:hypothetical protein J5N97_019330 [Dioscorea zingiberensis]
MKPVKVEEQQLDAYVGNISEDSSSIGMENDQILETRRNSFHRRSSSGNVREMVSTFETNLYQGLETHISPKIRTLISKFDTESSMKREFSVSNDIKKVKVPQSMTKSFSSGTLSEIKSQQHPTLDRLVTVKKLEKSQLYSDLISCDKKMTNNVQELIEIERATSIGGMVENSNERNMPFPVETKNGPSIVSIHEEFGKKTAPREVASMHLYSESSKSGEQTRAIGTEHNPTDETTQDRGRAPDINQTLERISVDDLQHSDKASFDIGYKQETKNENHVLAEEDLLVRNNLDKSLNSVGPCPCTNQDSSFSTAIQRSEQINCQTSNEDVLLSRYSDSRGCSSRSPVSCVPRQLCITIGSKQLRDLIECCDLSVGTHLLEHHHFINEAHEKECVQGETLLQVDESEDISPTSEDSNLRKSKAVEKSSGVLIEQVVRTVLVIVACGTLILNTRLRRPR